MVLILVSSSFVSIDALYFCSWPNFISEYDVFLLSSDQLKNVVFSIVTSYCLYDRQVQTTSVWASFNTKLAV